VIQYSTGSTAGRRCFLLLAAISPGIGEPDSTFAGHALARLEPRRIAVGWSNSAPTCADQASDIIFRGCFGAVKRADAETVLAMSAAGDTVRDHPQDFAAHGLVKRDREILSPALGSGGSFGAVMLRSPQSELLRQ